MHTHTFYSKLQSDPKGLASTEAEKRLLTHGPNELKAKKKKSLILEFLEEFKDLMVLILIGATIFAFFSGETADAIIIMVVVIINASIGFAQKYKAEKAIEALKKMVKPYARVLRDGIQKKIPAEKIVPGDILILNEGDSIAADAILIETNELETQEAILTGESLPVEKNIDGLVFMGTMVTHGTGRAIVVQTGMNTEMGNIATLTLETKKDKSPLEKEIQKIGFFVGKITFAICAVLFVFNYFLQKKPIIETLIFATSVAVAAVPEGLPATITIALAIGVQRLARQNAIIKQLSSVETLGATTVICTDKTGTLTKNEMMVKEIDLDEYSATVSGNGYEPYGTFHLECAAEKCTTFGNLKETDPDHATTKNIVNTEKETPTLYAAFQTFMAIAALCNNSEIRHENKQFKVIGDPTEGALITMVQKSGFLIEDFKSRYTKIHEFPFDSNRKLMTVLVMENSTKKYYAFSKGAPASILESCSEILKNGRSRDLTPAHQGEIGSKNAVMAEKAYRCLGFAYRELTDAEAEKINQADGNTQHKKFPLNKEQVEQHLTFVGLVGMMDPPRPEVIDAIELARKAGIRVYIVTGDYGLTAEAVAKQIGLIKDDNHQIIRGEELEKMAENELQAILKNKTAQVIFARVSPEHKLRIVSALKELGEVVAVTGDGVNDAPALKKADIGVAMGINGTDVSKEAANMVLSDDSFSTIINAIKEGRTIYENLKKFIYYVFSSNIGEVILIFLAIILAFPAPLSAVLILFVNLTTDMFPAVALGVEPAEIEVMNKKPRNPKSKILTKRFVGRILYNGLVIGVITFLAYIWELYRYGILNGNSTAASGLNGNPGYIKASSLAFFLMVILELANTFNARSEEKSIFKIDFFSNIQLLIANVISLLLAIMILEIPFFQKYFHTINMGLPEWGMVFISVALVIFAEEMRKLLRRRKTALKQHNA